MFTFKRKLYITSENIKSFFLIDMEINQELLKLKTPSLCITPRSSGIPDDLGVMHREGVFNFSSSWFISISIRKKLFIFSLVIYSFLLNVNKNN